MNVFHHVLAFRISGWRRKGRKQGQSWSINLRTTLLQLIFQSESEMQGFHAYNCLFLFELSWDFQKLWQECHTRSWQIVSDFLKQNLTLFVGKTSDGESTILPQSRAWLKDMSIEVGNSQDDHQIVLLLNCPSIGVLSAARLSFILTYISNILSDFPLNSVCFLIHPNRAGHQDGRQGYLCDTK